MKKFIVVIEVDEKKLRKELDNNTNDTIEWMIENEFGWLSSSGIKLLNIQKEVNKL